MDSYDIDKIREDVRERTGVDLKVIYLEETGSTNVWACDYVKAHEIDQTPVLVIADNQTAGRGRLGHTWNAQPGDGISMSLAFEPGMDMQRIPQITLAAGIAVRRALKETAGIEASVKWPNDILVIYGEDTKATQDIQDTKDTQDTENGRNAGGLCSRAAGNGGYRKLCGILCALSSGKVICGIGINVHNMHFPKEIARRAASVDICNGRVNSRTTIAAAVISELIALLDELKSKGWSSLKSEYDRYCVNREGRILLTDHMNPAGKKTGTAYGTDEAGRLRVRWDDGKSELLDAGEIELI